MKPRRREWRVIVPKVDARRVRLGPGPLVSSSCCAAPAGPLREQHLTGPSRQVPPHPPGHQLSSTITPRTWHPVTLIPTLCPAAGRWLEVGLLLPAAIYLSSFQNLPPSSPSLLPSLPPTPPSSVMFSAVPCRQGSLTECLLCYGFIGLVCGRNLWIKVISHCSTFSQAVKLPFTFVPLAERDRERHM